MSVGDDGRPAPEDLAALVDWFPEHHAETLAMRPDILILAARFGDGHMRAAKAIAYHLLSQHDDLSVGLLDYYGFVNPKLDHTIQWAYLTSVRRVPWLWRWFYVSTQRIDPSSTTQALLNRIGMERFYEAIRPRPPKVILSTYPTAAGVVSTLKRKRLLNVVNYVVMTDYGVHSQWIHEGVDRYFVGGEDMVEELKHRGVDPRQVEVTGIPVDDRFSQPVDGAAVLRRLGLSADRPTVLYMGGSYLPPGRYERVLAALDRIAPPHNLIIVGGRDPARQQAAEAFARQSRHPTLAFGFRDDVHELMAASTLLITKAGGLTVTEALCRGLPMVIYRQIPGQEDENARFLSRHGAGRIVRREADLVAVVTTLLNRPDELARMAQAARSLARPDAAERIARRLREALERQWVNAPA